MFMLLHIQLNAYGVRLPELHFWCWHGRPVHTSLRHLLGVQLSSTDLSSILCSVSDFSLSSPSCQILKGFNAKDPKYIDAMVNHLDF